MRIYLIEKCIDHKNMNKKILKIIFEINMFIKEII